MVTFRHHPFVVGPIGFVVYPNPLTTGTSKVLVDCYWGGRDWCPDSLDYLPCIHTKPVGVGSGDLIKTKS